MGAEKKMSLRDPPNEPMIAGEVRLMRATPMAAGDILTLLRQHNIPCSIDSFAEMGWTAKLGDPAKGFYAQQSRFPTLDAAASWLLEEARRQFPGAMPGAATRSGAP
jgi:hypothetical protein